MPWSVPDDTGLSAEYARLKRIYADAVDRLFAIGYQVSDAEYKRLKNTVEEARVQLEMARFRLEEQKPAVHSRAG